MNDVVDSHEGSRIAPPIRWGIVGFGDICAKRVADAIRADSNSLLVAACRRQPDRLDELCNRFDIPSRFTSTAEMLELADIDAVYVATPVDQHANLSILALDHGKHVLVEKPMALNAEQCQLMCEAALRNRRQLSVAYYRRFYPLFTRIKTHLIQGTIGPIMSIRATTGNGTAFDVADWRVVRSQGGGGPLMDIGSHRLDLFLDLFGIPERVVACMSRIEADYEVENCATVVLQFAKGIHGNLSCYFGTSNVPDALEIVGRSGRLMIPNLNGSELQVITDQGSKIEHYPPPTNLHAPLIADFTTAILSDRLPTITSEQGLRVSEVLDRAYRSVDFALRNEKKPSTAAHS